MSKRRNINVVSCKTKIATILSKFPPTNERYGEDKVNWEIILSVRLLRHEIYEARFI